MEKMNAIFLVKHGSAEDAFEIREIDRPRPIKDQVLVKVKGFGLNFADVLARRGLYRDAPPIPSVLGYDLVGEVVEVGENVSKDLIGKSIVSLIRFGGYAEYAVVEVGGMAIISGDANWGQALTLGAQYCTAYYASSVLTNLIAGDKVLVHSAAGGVGIALTQLAKLGGCTVIGTAGSNEKVDFIKNQLGVDHAINYEKEDCWEKINAIYGKDELDISFNALGGKTFKKDWSLLKPTGKIVCYGATNRLGARFGILSDLNLIKNFGFYSPLFLMMGSKSILGVNMLRVSEQKPHVIQHCLKSLVDLLETKKISPVVAKEFKATDIAEAHSYLENRKAIGKVVVSW